MGLVNSRQQTGKHHTTINSENKEPDRSISPPDQFKFSKVQRLKLSVIFANLAPISVQLQDNTPPTEQFDNLSINNDEIYDSKSKASPSFDITDTHESFVATISTLIGALNRADLAAHSSNNLIELLKLFTAVFIKNINIRSLIEFFEFQVEEDKCITELLLSAYIKAIATLSLSTNICSDLVLEEILKTLLILISSNVYLINGEQGIYFHSYLGKLPIDQVKDLIDSLLAITCTFNLKSSHFLISTTTPSFPEKSRLSSQLLASICILKCSNEIFSNFNDLKSFALFIKFQSQFLQLTTNYSVNESTILIIFCNFMVNFCSNYRRFLLSKLDSEELIISLAKGMYFLMRGKLYHKKPITSRNLYFLAEIFLSLSEDTTFIKLIFDNELNRNLIKWYDGDLGTCSSLGGFLFCLLLDLLGANLAASDGFKDQFLHEILTAILINFAQFYNISANSSVCDRFWAIFNGLFPQIHQKKQPTSSAEVAIDSEASQCLVDILVIFFNIIINNSQRNPLLIGQFLTDKDRFIRFLQTYLDYIDSSTNSQLSAHLNESELEFTAIVVGILKFIQKLSNHLEFVDVYEIPSALATFPIPTFRRDSRGEVHRLGTRMRLNRPINHQDWSKFIEHEIWSIIYSSIPWNRYVE